MPSTEPVRWRSSASTKMDGRLCLMVCTAPCSTSISCPSTFDKSHIFKFIGIEWFALNVDCVDLAQCTDLTFKLVRRLDSTVADVHLGDAQDGGAGTV